MSQIEAGMTPSAATPRFSGCSHRKELLALAARMEALMLSIMKLASSTAAALAGVSHGKPLGHRASKRLGARLAAPSPAVRVTWRTGDEDCAWFRHQPENLFPHTVLCEVMLVIKTDVEFKNAYPWNELLKAGAYVAVSRGPRKGINHREWS